MADHLQQQRVRACSHRSRFRIFSGSGIFLYQRSTGEVLMKSLGAALALLTPAFALASQTGQALDCSDMVFQLPGLRCVQVSERPCVNQFCRGVVETSNMYRWRDPAGSFRVTDNEGHILLALRDPAVHRFEIKRFDGITEEVVAYVADRWTSDGSSMDELLPGAMPEADQYQQVAVPILFDDKRGRLLIAVRSTCEGPCRNYGNWHWILAIDGFATTFDVLQTYTPTSPSQTLGFRVPYMPEGFPAADHFDTYYGDVTRPLDLSNARALQCGFPTSAPGVGEYEQVTAPVPTPAPGHAQYVLTTVTYQGRTRAGRQAIDGTLRGRDASVLPACVVERKATDMTPREASR